MIRITQLEGRTIKTAVKEGDTVSLILDNGDTADFVASHGYSREVSETVSTLEITLKTVTEIKF